MKTLGKDDGEATKAGGIAVRKDVEQRVEKGVGGVSVPCSLAP